MVPENKDKQKMITEALSIGLLMVMKNHVYKLDMDVKLQKNGEPIGLQLIGVGPNCPDIYDLVGWKTKRTFEGK